MAHGGTLTINPETGLPEAGFLDSILPTLLGGAATFFSGGTITPFMAALGVGGLTALTSKDLGKGLMAGLGAYGGSGIMEGLAGFGTGALSAEAGGAAINAAGVNPLSFEADQIAQNAIAPKIANASYYDKIAAGASKAMSEPMNALSAIGGGSKLKGAAMLGAPLLSAISSQDQTSVPTAEQIKFDPRYANINISRQQLPYQPDTGGSKERRYFGNTYVTQYADGGAVANDGIEHFAYGGGTIDSTYDYSGYGDRSKSSVMQPITHTEAPKPDFVAADGKTYRYDPVKKSWYVIKEAEDKKVNAGVETLMGDGSNAGDARGPGTDNTGTGQTFYGGLANLAGEAQRAGFTTIGNFLGGLVPVGAEYNRVDLDTGNTVKGALTAADIAALSGKSDKGSSVSLGGTNTGENEGVNTNTGTTGMNTGTTGGSPAQAGDIGNPGGPAGGYDVGNAPSGDNAKGGMVGHYAHGGIMGINRVKRFNEGGEGFGYGEGAGAAQGAGVGGYGSEGEGYGDGGDYVTVSETSNSMKGTPAYSMAAMHNSPNPIFGGYPNAVQVSNVDQDKSATSNTYGYQNAQQARDAYDSFAAEQSMKNDRAHGGMVGSYAQGGLGSLGGYSDGGRLLRGPGDGVSDSIPATVGNRQPARLADGEFVVPARIVSELGNGSTEAGARALYKMMDRIQANRRKTTGKNSVAVNSKSHKYLPA